jgi:hypothetical protein
MDRCQRATHRYAEVCRVLEPLPLELTVERHGVVDPSSDVVGMRRVDSFI